MRISLILNLAAMLLAATAHGTEPTAWELQFQVDGTFRDAAARTGHLYLLAAEVAAGEPDVLVLRLVEGGVVQQVSRYTARYSPSRCLPAAAGCS